MVDLEPIACSERMPDERQMCLVYMPEVNRAEDYAFVWRLAYWQHKPGGVPIDGPYPEYKRGGGGYTEPSVMWYDVATFTNRPLEAVTHWLPLPPEPTART